MGTVLTEISTFFGNTYIMRQVRQGKSCARLKKCQRFRCQNLLKNAVQLVYFGPRVFYGVFNLGNICCMW